MNNVRFFFILEKIMKTGNISQPLSQSVKTASYPKTSLCTCPHGMSPGSCPICSGSGGGGGGAAKKNKMSWNEGFGIWMSILATRKNVQQRKEFFNQSLLVDQTKNRFELLNSARFFTAVNSMMKSFKSAIQPLSDLKNIISSTIKDVKIFTANLISKVSQFVNDLQAKLTGVINMISAFLGEQQKILKEFLNKALENLKKLSFLKHTAKKFGQLIAHKTAEITQHIFEKLNQAKKMFNDLFKKLKTNTEKNKKKKIENKQKESSNVNPITN